jgi:hypothetical protein
MPMIKKKPSNKFINKYASLIKKPLDVVQNSAAGKRLSLL